MSKDLPLTPSAPFEAGGFTPENHAARHFDSATVDCPNGGKHLLSGGWCAKCHTVYCYPGWGQPANGAEGVKPQ